MRNRRVAYLLLSILFVLSAAYEFGFAYRVLHVLRAGPQMASEPLDFGFRVRMITGITAEAKKAGIRWGDYLEEIGGNPFTRLSLLHEVVADKHPGDSVPIVVRRADASLFRTAIRLAPVRGQATPGDWVLRLCLRIFLPILCLTLGFWVVMVRPLDRLAWLLLGLMESFAVTAWNFAWDGPGLAAGVAWSVALGNSWPIWMLLFGIYFPERASFDRKRPWAKWVLIVPLTLTTLVFVWFVTAREFSFAWVEPLAPILNPNYQVHMYVGMAAVGIFFALLGHKSGTASSADSRRRLSILLWGAFVSLTPMFLMMVYALARGQDPGVGLPGSIQLAVIILFALFPLTLAYVIVVQRAMEVRVALRQSLKYGFARGGLWALRILIGGIALITVINGVNAHRSVDKVRVIALGALLFVVQRRGADRVTRWIDRRFFREAYSAEQVLSELSDQVRSFVETRPLLETVSHRVSDTLHVARMTILLRDGDGFRTAQVIGDRAPSSGSLSPESKTMQYLRTARRPAFVYFDDPQSWVHEAAPDEQEFLKTMDAQLLLPLSGREQLVGVMALGPKRSEEPYSRSDLQLLQSVATQTGLSLENSQLMASLAAETAQRERASREMEIAREVQERLFPQSYPDIPGVDYYGCCRPALGVGGDYYDFVPLPDGKVGIAIGDVSGKGISAALLMASLQASLRGQTMARMTDLSKLMSNVNQLVYEASTSNRYATFFYGQYDPRTRNLEYVNAGHNAPVILRGEEVLRLEAGGPVVGLLKGVAYLDANCQLEPGDVFIGYTDGISEAMTAEDEEWGEDRMIEAARCCCRDQARDAVECLLRAADAFTAGAKQHDDMTLMVFKVRKSTGINGSDVSSSGTP